MLPNRLSESSRTVAQILSRAPQFNDRKDVRAPTGEREHIKRFATKQWFSNCQQLKGALGDMPPMYNNTTQLLVLGADCSSGLSNSTETSLRTTYRRGGMLLPEGA